MSEKSRELSLLKALERLEKFLHQMRASQVKRTDMREAQLLEEIVKEQVNREDTYSSTRSAR
jgi:hypothetical protein